MKNFYEATVIKPTLKVNIVLHLIPVGSVKTHLKINDTSYNLEITKEQAIEHQVKLTDPIDIQIQVDRKHPEALVVKLQIDGHEILPKYQFLANPPTDYVDFPGIWAFKIPNFYIWLHEVSGQGWIV